MGAQANSKIADILTRYEGDLLPEWIDLQVDAVTLRRDLMNDVELRDQSKQFLEVLARVAASDGKLDLNGAEWTDVREFLSDLSRSRARQGFTPSETASFVFSLKQPLFARMRKECGGDADTLATELWKVTVLLDKLGLLTTEVFLMSREEVIGRQQQEMLELSTPVVELWDGVLALPLIGALDSARTQVVMENLLEKIVETGAGLAIIDITGVPTVDTLVAQHLLKTVAAARLMGAECIISGIRPQIAQTIVHLGVDLSAVITKATLADGLGIAFKKLGLAIAPVVAAPAAAHP